MPRDLTVPVPAWVLPFLRPDERKIAAASAEQYQHVRSLLGTLGFAVEEIDATREPKTE